MYLSLSAHITDHKLITIYACRFVFEDQIDFIKASVMDGDKVC